MAKRRVEEDATPEPELVTEVIIKIYKPIKSIPFTHKPIITFAGKVLSMKEVSMIEFYTRKELRRYKIEYAKRLTEESEEVR